MGGENENTKINFLSCLLFRNMLYVAPSGVQKERLEADDLFVLKLDGSISQAPPMDRKLTLSQCTPLFMNAYKGEDGGENKLGSCEKRVHWFEHGNKI